MPSTDASQQRLYSPSNHVSPGKATSCLSKRPTSSGSATTPPSGVLKNVMVSHHMDRSSSTPRLTLKFHHVKRHENGIATAADGSRIHAVADGTGQQLPAAISAGSKPACSISCPDSQYLTASSSGTRYHGGDGDSESHQVAKNSFEKNQNSTSAERPCSQQSAVMPFSPQFEDISDAEDEVRPLTVNSRDSRCTVPAYGLPPSAAQCLPPLTTGFYPSTNSSTFCTSAAVSVLSTFPPVVGWNSYSGFASQTAMTLPVSSVQSYGVMLPWASENHSQRGVINYLPPQMSSGGGNGPISAADVLQMSLSSKQPFFGNRLLASDSAGFPKSELLPVKSEVLQNEMAAGHQMSIKSERYNGHVGDDSYIKAESPSSRAEIGRKLVASTLESKPNNIASQPKFEEMVSSNIDDRDTFMRSHHIHKAEDDDSMKAGSFDSGSNLHNSLQIKRDVSSVSPSQSPCHHYPAISISPSVQSSGSEPSATVNTLASSTQITSDVAQVPNSLEPKVPPLRIVIPSKVCTSGSLSDGTNANITSRCSISSLPYVVNRTNSADSGMLTSAADTVHRCDSSPAVFASSDSDRLSASKEFLSNSELVPAKRRKMKHSSRVSVSLLVFVIIVFACFCLFLHNMGFSYF